MAIAASLLSSLILVSICGIFAYNYVRLETIAKVEIGYRQTLYSLLFDVRYEEHIDLRLKKYRNAYEEITTLARKAGIDTPAFSTAPLDNQEEIVGGAYVASKNRSLIIVGNNTFLKLSIDEFKALVAHEIGHVVRSNFMKFSLMLYVYIQNLYAVGEAFAIACAAFLFLLPFGIFTVEIFLFLCLSTFGLYAVGTVLQLLYLHLSRKEEYRADRFAAKFLGSPEPMIVFLSKYHSSHDTGWIQKKLGIVGEYLTRTHPSNEKRIAQLRKLENKAA